MNSLTRNLTILWRSERLLAEAEWRRASRQITILVLAGVFTLLALVMMNVAGFYWLAGSYGNAPAASPSGLPTLCSLPSLASPRNL